MSTEFKFEVYLVEPHELRPGWNKAKQILLGKDFFVPAGGMPNIGEFLEIRGETYSVLNKILSVDSGPNRLLLVKGSLNIEFTEKKEEKEVLVRSIETDVPPPAG